MKGAVPGALGRQKKQRLLNLEGPPGWPEAVFSELIPPLQPAKGGPMGPQPLSQALPQRLQAGLCHSRKGKDSHPLPHLTASHHHGDQQPGQNPSVSLSFIYSPSLCCSASPLLPSLFLRSVLFDFFLRLPFSPSLFPPPLPPISVHFCIMLLCLFHHLSVQTCSRAPER